VSEWDRGNPQLVFWPRFELMTSRVLILAPPALQHGAGEETMFFVWPVGWAVAGCFENANHPSRGSSGRLCRVATPATCWCSDDGWVGFGNRRFWRNGAPRHWVSCARRFEACLFRFEGSKCLNMRLPAHREADRPLAFIHQCEDRMELCLQRILVN
jgi:hypothetical protein